jgi:hypothetical protein
MKTQALHLSLLVMALSTTPVHARLMTVHFRRDKSGKVVGFDYSNPIIRSTKFTRLGDHT